MRHATPEQLERVHERSYLDLLQRIDRPVLLDADTLASETSWEAATLAAGVALEAVDRGGFALVRPPGHHALADRAMGFCLLNNVAAAAAAARARGAARVAIVDWDVHHGNGTQDIFWDDPTVMYQSVHQFPYYPGSGSPAEVGGPNAIGATVNVGLQGGSGDADYAAVFDHVFVPALERFRPDLVLVSAGFDAFEYDPLAGMRVSLAGFGGMASRLRALADRVCGGRIVAVLEGGYDLAGLAGGMTSVLGALLAPKVGAPPFVPLPAGGSVRAAIDATLAAHAAAGVPIPAPER